jgi:hypothetical protein
MDSLQNATRSLRSGTLRLLEADPPPGMWAATANATSQAPTLADIRSGRVGREGSVMGEEVHGALDRRRSSLSGGASGGGVARTRTNSSLEARRGMGERTRTEGSLSGGGKSPRIGKRQGSFGFGRKGSAVEEEVQVPRVSEENHGIAEVARKSGERGAVGRTGEAIDEEAEVENMETKKGRLTDAELAEVRSDV